MEPDYLSRWEEAFRYFSSAYYYEMLAALLSHRWERWGGGMSFVIALTASGSAVSGWGL